MSEGREDRYTDEDSLYFDKHFKVFFKGRDVNQRMDFVRQSIHFVRDNWDNKDIRKFLFDRLYENYKIEIERKIIESKNWIEFQSPKEKLDKYDLLTYYTTTNGYKQYKKLNNLYRKKDLNIDECNLATFFVELLNIDLYNYVYSTPKVQNFNGTIYRGLNLNATIAASIFDKITKDDIEKRNIGIPLEFMSATLDKNCALLFATKNRKSIKKVPIILEIHVRNLSQTLLNVYKNFYSDSPVTSLCAVPIADLSVEKDEQEVLLRGAFFHVLNVRFEYGITIIETLMLNSNRDHILTNNYNKTNAQSLFRSLISYDKLCKSLDFITDYKERQKYLNEIEIARQSMEQNIKISESENK